MFLSRIATLAATTALTALPAFAGPTSMTVDEARHLISRTGFGASPDEISAMVGKSYADGVAAILAGVSTEPVQPMPTWVDDWAYPFEHIWTLDQTTTELLLRPRPR